MKHRVSYCFDKFLWGFCAQVYTKHFRLGAACDGWRDFMLGVEILKSGDSVQFYLSLGNVYLFFIVTADWLYRVRKYD